MAYIKGIKVIEGYDDEARDERWVVVVGNWVSRGRHGSDGPAPEVVFTEDVLRLALGHPLHLVRPLTGQLHRRLPSLHT